MVRSITFIIFIKSIEIIRKSHFYLSTKSLRTLYFSLVYPYFFYCNLVWASTYKSSLVRLEILQKRVVRTIAKTDLYAHTDPIFKILGILKFHDMHLLQLGLFMYSHQNRTLPLKFDCKFTLQKDIHSYPTRNSHLYRLPLCRINIKQFSVFYRGPKFYNSLSTEIVNSSSSVSFKKEGCPILRQIYAHHCIVLYPHNNRLTIQLRTTQYNRIQYNAMHKFVGVLDKYVKKALKAFFCNNY